MQNITIQGDNPRIDFGVAQFKAAPSAPIVVVNLDDPSAAAQYRGDALAPQAYSLSKDGADWMLVGDSAGCMYGLIDIADAERAGANWPEGCHKPYIAERGIKMNIPLDARTPSYADAGDSAWNNIPHMWEMDFWCTMLDDLARDKYNLLSIWSLHPFPSMVRVPGYEEVALQDVKRTKSTVTGATTAGLGMYGKRFAADLETVHVMDMDKKIEFWRAVMQYAHDRGIAFYVITWNVFIYGTEHTDYGITCDLDNPVTQDYFRKSVEAMVRTYPLLRGIGVTAGERMTVGWSPNPDLTKDVKWLADTYGRGIADAIGDTQRPFRLVHRQHMSGAEEIISAFKDIPVEVDFSFKYSQAHMYSDTRPHFGDKFFASIPEGYKTFLTVRNDDIYMMRWGGVAFAREYLNNMPTPVMRGFMMGPDGYTWGRDYIARAEEGMMPRRTVLDRQGYMMAIWGRLAYDPALPVDHFVAYLSERLDCGMDQAQRVFKLCETVSMVLPQINRVRWHDFDFQSYPEANCCVSTTRHVAHIGGEVIFQDVHDYILTPAQPGTDYLGVQEFCLMEHSGQAVPEGKHAPVEVADQLLAIAGDAEAQLKQFTAARGELAALLADCRGFALLSRFFGHKVWAAISTQRALMKNVPSQHAQRAIESADSALSAWEAYVNYISKFYVPQRLTRTDGRLVDVTALTSQARQDAQIVHDIMQEYE